MDFNNRVVTTVDIFGHNVWITQTHISTWVIMAVLILVALMIRSTIGRFTEVPTGKQNLVEFAVETFDNFVVSTMGANLRGFGNWFFGIFIFVLASNFSGLFGLRPPTADVSTTLVLSTTTFLLVHITGLIKAPREYFKGYLQPFFLFLPMNIIGELSIIVSLAFRLFGNILSGVMILGVVYYLLPWGLTLVLPAFLHAYFDIFAGSIQAFIFTILSMMFIQGKT